MTDKLVEVDTRPIQGNGGSIVLYMDGVDDPYQVHVMDSHGEHRHTLYATTRASALEAFWHPFASLGTPNLFERVPEDDPASWTIPGDGYADGGTPYTSDEVAA